MSDCRCFTPFSTLFQLYHGRYISMRYLWFLIPVLHTIFYRSHWLLSYITVVEIMISHEKRINTFAITITHPREARDQQENPCSEVLGQYSFTVLKSIRLFSKTLQIIYHKSVVGHCKTKISLKCFNETGP